MALNTDLNTLITQLTATDAVLASAQANIAKYPRLFSSTASGIVVQARADLASVIKELTDGTNLITQLTSALKA